jgi:Putative Flp pilus-assembly TadE/G-like
LRRHRTDLRPNSRRNNEQGIVIMLVAVVMLFVVGAMAALSIDVVTLYTARSEAQLAADGAALAGARVLANSGMTSASDSTVGVAAVPLATAVALQVAASNPVGGRNLNPAGACPGGEICVTINELASNFVANPHVTVQVQRSDLPTFFARIWGTKTVTVKASATAEAYNPSNVPGTSVNPKLPVALMCVKPWLLPNLDPSGSATIFSATTGAITNPALLGWTTPPAPPPNAKRLQPACIDCSVTPLPTPVAWKYYPGDPASFPAPTQALPSCSPALATPYEESVAGCIQTPIACNSTATIDISEYDNRNTETSHAVNCLTHAAGNEGDKVDLTAAAAPSPPFQFLVGEDNPVAVVNPSLAGKDAMVSSSLVTVPVFDSGNPTNPPPNPVTIIGFMQLFLNPDGDATPNNGPNGGYVKTTVINLVGCGTGIAGQPILGNGASPVAVRLISP